MFRISKFWRAVLWAALVAAAVAACGKAAAQTGRDADSLAKKVLDAFMDGYLHGLFEQLAGEPDPWLNRIRFELRTNSKVDSVRAFTAPPCKRFQNALRSRDALIVPVITTDNQDSVAIVLLRNFVADVRAVAAVRRPPACINTMQAANWASWISISFPL